MDLLEYTLSKYPVGHDSNNQGEEDYEVEEKLDYFLRPDKEILKKED